MLHDIYIYIYTCICNWYLVLHACCIVLFLRFIVPTWYCELEGTQSFGRHQFGSSKMHPFAAGQSHFNAIKRLQNEDGQKGSAQLGQNAVNITIMLYNALYFVLYFLILTLLKSFVEWLNGFVDCREQQSRDLDDYNVMTFVAFCLYSPLWLAGPTMTFNAFASHIRDRQMQACFKCCLRSIEVVS